jgi:hypothetical protein
MYLTVVLFWSWNPNPWNWTWPQIRRYRAKAQATREDARKATSQESREAYLKLAIEWDALANEMESALSVQQFEFERAYTA